MTDNLLDEAAQALTDDPMWNDLFHEVWSLVAYKPGYELLLLHDQRVDGGRWYYQVEAHRPDTYTREPGVGRGSKAYLNPAATRSELAQTAFGLFNAYEHHECREWFTFAGKRVYGPHFDVLALAEIADRTEHRGDPT